MCDGLEAFVIKLTYLEKNYLIFALENEIFILMSLPNRIHYNIGIW